MSLEKAKFNKIITDIDLDYSQFVFTYVNAYSCTSMYITQPLNYNSENIPIVKSNLVFYTIFHSL